MKLCEYGCGQEGKFPFKNGKWCCSKSQTSCPEQRKKNSMKVKEARKDPTSKYNSSLYREKISINMKKLWRSPDSIFNSILFRENRSNILKEAHNDPNSKYNSSSCREKKSNSMKGIWKDQDSIFNSISFREKLSKSFRITIEQIKERYLFFSKIEEMRYNPNKLKEKEIQVHCKNHECENSKEKGGWFTPTYIQLYERIRQLESKEGNGGSYLYCSQHCKDTCPLYNLYGDPLKENNLPYTQAELDTFNKHILTRNNEICYYCGEHHATIVHHLRPQKLEPFFALDPDYAVSVCKKCHYEKGHPTGSEHSTGNLAKIVCSVESQKFLDQNKKGK